MSRIATAIDRILDAIIAPALWRIHRAAIAAHERVTGRVPLTPENLARAMGVRLGGEEVPEPHDAVCGFYSRFSHDDPSCYTCGGNASDHKAGTHTMSRGGDA